MSVKARLSWIVKGSAHTDAALQQLGRDLRDLQQKVEALSVDVAAIDARVAAGTHTADVERLETSVTAIRAQLRAVTDDLGDRVSAVTARLDTQR